MKRVAILQSNYIPWKGYFDLIANVDEFVLYDDMQYTRRDWRNRNQLKTSAGLQWLTIPVKTKGKYLQSICETAISDSRWQFKHWKTIDINYKHSPYYRETKKLLEPLYLDREYLWLSEVNQAFIMAICNYLSIKTKISQSSDFSLSAGKTERLIGICEQASASEYVSGPSARDYIEPRLFEQHSIALRWFDYNGYPCYPQLWGDFIHHVSIIDLLFNCGPDSMRYIKRIPKPLQ